MTVKTEATLKQPIPLFHLPGYRRWCWPWWRERLRYFTGVQLREYEVPPLVSLGWPGWVWDIHTYWHRARYGWAPSDVWDLDGYLNGVLAGSLEHLAQTAHGTPSGYPNPDGAEKTDHDRWGSDLLRWAKAFSEDPQDVRIYDKPKHIRHRAEEDRRRKALHQALKEIEPWWEALWD